MLGKDTQYKTICVLAPFADMANTTTQDKFNTHWEFNGEDGSLEFSSYGIKKDEPVFFFIILKIKILISYGKFSNFTFLHYYGFVLEDKFNQGVKILFDYDNIQIKNADLKKGATRTRPFEFRYKTFYFDYKKRNEVNSRFFKFCRFYFSELNPEDLISVFSVVWIIILKIVRRAKMYRY